LEVGQVPGDLPVLEAGPVEPAVASAPTWHAEEEEITADDLAFDLEDVMRNAEPEAHVPDGSVHPDGVPDLPESADLGANFASSQAGPLHEPISATDESSEPEFDPFVDLAAAPALEPPRSVASPMLAPIGKTSFDELDAIMEQAATRFESSSPATADAPVAEPIQDSSEAELQAEGFAPDPLNAASDQDPLESDLVVEEMPVASETATPSLHSSSGLSGVFDLEEPTTPADVAASADVLDEVPGEPQSEPLVDTPSIDHTGIGHYVEAAPMVQPESVKVSGLSVPATEPVVGTAEEPVVLDRAADMVVAAVNAETKSVPDEQSHGPVERVVERVVDRLRPMLTVMVEEIMKEVKKNG
jgi:hypothetical protein